MNVCQAGPFNKNRKIIQDFQTYLDSEFAEVIVQLDTQRFLDAMGSRFTETMAHSLILQLQNQLKI
jgi:hypothetical protein